MGSTTQSRCAQGTEHAQHRARILTVISDSTPALPSGEFLRASLRHKRWRHHHRLHRSRHWRCVTRTRRSLHTIACSVQQKPRHSHSQRSPLTRFLGPSLHQASSSTPLAISHTRTTPQPRAHGVASPPQAQRHPPSPLITTAPWHAGAAASPRRALPRSSPRSLASPSTDAPWRAAARQASPSLSSCSGVHRPLPMASSSCLWRARSPTPRGICWTASATGVSLTATLRLRAPFRPTHCHLRLLPSRPRPRCLRRLRRLRHRHHSPSRTKKPPPPAHRQLLHLTTRAPRRAESSPG